MCRRGPIIKSTVRRTGVDGFIIDVKDCPTETETETETEADIANLGPPGFQSDEFSRANSVG